MRNPMRMKFIRMLAVTLCLAGMFSRTAAQAAAPSSAYEEGRRAYIARTSNEVQAIRQEVDNANKDATPDAKRRYADFYVQLDLCEKLLAELKAAAPGDFDQVKSRYEQQRAVLVKARAKADAR